jgi:hypothetical protein
VMGARRLRFVVIGEVAERLHGSPVEPETLSLCAEPESLNRARLRVLLRTFKRYRLRYGTFRWRWTPPPPLRSYQDLSRAAVEVPIAHHPVTVASLDDLIRMRLAARTPEHAHAADVLAAVREEADRLRSGRR